MPWFHLSWIKLTNIFGTWKIKVSLYLKSMHIIHLHQWHTVEKGSAINHSTTGTQQLWPEISEHNSSLLPPSEQWTAEHRLFCIQTKRLWIQHCLAQTELVSSLSACKHYPSQSRSCNTWVAKTSNCLAAWGRAATDVRKCEQQWNWRLEQVILREINAASPESQD